MSEPIKHECGFAYVRLRKPLGYYAKKYGDALWGLKKLFYLLQKQRNRGHDGVGFGCCKVDVNHGQRYMFCERSAKRDALGPVFGDILKDYRALKNEGKIRKKKPETIRENFDFGGENLFGHLRYATSGGGSNKKFCHPLVRQSNWKTKSLMLLGNFNMTNVGELKAAMIDRGQHPFQDIDTQVVLEDIGFYLDEAHDSIYHRYQNELPGHEIPERIGEELDVPKIIEEAAQDWDGGYTIAGAVGNGDGFVIRDPNGIRPCFFFEDEEFIAFASERPPLMTVFDKPLAEIQELEPAHVAWVKNTPEGEMRMVPFTAPRRRLPCSFERIYFSRGSDHDIYRERKAMGAALVDQVLDEIGGDFGDAVFTFIPNTAETGYLGMMDELNRRRREQLRQELAAAAENGTIGRVLDESIDRPWPKGEKLAHKDERFRTFISNERSRKEMVALGYDITYGQVENAQTLVALDDSIVRGTTLRESLVGILGRLKPRKIVIVSTAPQIRYPDCYGIDMSELGKFLAFNAAIDLLESTGRTHILAETYIACKAALESEECEKRNFVREIYRPFSAEELSAEMSRQVCPKIKGWDKEVVLIFQNIENLRTALGHGGKSYGDWYFTGNYPTPGGYRVVNRAFVNFIEENEDQRPYDDWLKQLKSRPNRTP